MKIKKFSKFTLLMLSIVSFLAAGTLSSRAEEKSLFLIKLFVLLLISFASLTAFFIKTEKFQDILQKGRVKRGIKMFLPVAVLFFIALGYALHMDDGTYAIWTTIDSVSYYIQAKIFATGQLSVPSHELKDFFSTGFFINDGKYYSKYFPGWPLILSIGITIGLPWIINPVISILSLVIIYFIGKEIYDTDTGLFATLLFVTSGSFYVLTPTYFSEPSALLFSSVFFYCMIKTIKEPKILNSLLAGLSLCVAFMIRPYSAIAISLPVTGYFIYTAFIERKGFLRSFILFASGFSPALIILPLYNYLQTGDIFLSPFQYYNPFDKLGFGLRSFDTVMDPYPFTLLTALRNTSINLALLNQEAVPFFFIFLTGVLINKKNRWDMLLLATLFSIVFFHMFYFYRSTRYYYAAFFAIFLLSARGISLSDLSVNKFFPDLRVKNLCHLFLLFITIVNVFIITSPMKFIYNYKSSQKMSDPFNTLETNNINNAVVILRKVPRKDNYTRMYVQNPLDYEGEVLFAMDLKERNKELMEFYPDKEFYYYDFDQRSRAGMLTKVGRDMKK